MEMKEVIGVLEKLKPDLSIKRIKQQYRNPELEKDIVKNNALTFAIEVLGRIDVEKIREHLEYWGYRQLNLIKLNDSDNLKIAQAIVKYLEGGKE